MKKHLVKTISTLCLLICATCCGHKINIAEPVKIGRFDSAIMHYQTFNEEQKLCFADTFATTIDMLFGNKCNRDSILLAYSKSPGVSIFTPDVLRLIPSTDSISEALGIIRHNLNIMLPKIKWPEINAITSTYNQSVYVGDSLLLVGLNHYLGEDYEGYSRFETYQRQTKTISHLSYDILEAILLTNYPYKPSDDDIVINHILYNGAIAYALKMCIESATMNEILGCTPAQLSWLNINEAKIWQTMIERQLLFSTDTNLAKILIRPAPSCSVIHPDAPGRVGRYIGFRIVESYMKNNTNAQCEYLLSPEFYNNQQSLIVADYSPFQ